MSCQRAESFNHLVITEMLQFVYISYRSMAKQLLMPLGLTLAQCEILLLLYQRAPEVVETGELLQITKISPSSLSYTMQKLKRNGYIDYTRNGDQRKKQVRLTDKALKIQEKIDEIFQYLEDTFFSGMTDAERMSVERVFLKIAQNISDIPTRGAVNKYPVFADKDE